MRATKRQLSKTVLSDMNAMTAVPDRPAHGVARSLALISAVILIMLGLLAVPHTAQGAGTTFYLSPQGSDANPGTLSAPWKSIDTAMEALQPGDTLLMRGGDYVQRVEYPRLTSGAASSGISVRAYPGERPVIHGVLWIKGVDYWRFDGINVTWDDATGQPDDHMVKITDGVGWSFANGEVWGARSFAAMLVASSVTGEPSNWTITGNCIHDTYSTNGTNEDQLLYVNSGLTGTGGLIERNLLFNAENGNGVKLGGSSSDKGGAAGVTVRYNTIVNTVHNVLIAWRSHDNLVERNLLYGVTNNNANIRGYRLTGTGNVASFNAGGGSQALIRNDDGYGGIANGGGNVYPVTPDFDATSTCGAFHSSIAGYGHLADSGGSTFSDVGPTHIFFSEIEQLYASGITNGCGGGRFCPDSFVTRGEMAAFLTRALVLPRNAPDQFTDDDASPFEADINAIANAGIAQGCAIDPPRFCPDSFVTRGQMAAFLTRALGLPGDAPDRFFDDDGSPFEPDINAIANAGITRGCAIDPPYFCPDSFVTRGQMAAFLIRAFNP